MIGLAEALLAVVTTMVPPGGSVHSVEVCADPAPDCRPSTFYDGFVRKETRETAEARYRTIVDAIVSVSAEALCMTPEGDSVYGCVRPKDWTLPQLVSFVTAVSIAESGWREDVQVGRGSSLVPSIDGGRGRGPSGEWCLMQIHPTSLDTYMGSDLVGVQSANLTACFARGVAMVVRARSFCAWKMRGDKLTGHTWVTETVALYGTGVSCTSANGRKTAYRVGLYEHVYNALVRRMKAK